MRRGGEKDDEDTNFAFHTHTASSVLVYRHDVRRNDRRLRWWWRKVNTLLRFLLMIEKHPKRGVWAEFCPFRMSIVVPVSIVSVLCCAGIGFLMYRVAGFFIFLFCGLCGFFELLHVAFDR